MQGTRVQSLVWEDPTCWGASKPLSCNYWASVPRECAPNKEKWLKWGPQALPLESTQLTATRDSPHKATKTQWSQKGKEREKLNIRMRVNRAGLKGILWKTCLQGGPLADIKEPGFCKDPTTLNDTSGLYWTPTLLLGVWNFDMCEAEGACVISPQQKAWGTKC